MPSLLLKKLIRLTTSQVALYSFAAITCFITIMITIQLHHNNGYVTVWLPNTIIIVAILRSQKKYAMSYFITGILSNLAATLFMGKSLDTAMVYAFSNSLMTSSAIIYIHYHHARLNSNYNTQRFHQQATTMGIYLVTGCLLSAIVGGSYLAIQSSLPLIKAIVSWFSANLLPLLALLPAGLSVTRKKLMTLCQLKNFSRFAIIATILVLVAIEGICYATHPFIILLMPLLFSALYFNLFEMTLLCLIDTITFVVFQSRLSSHFQILDPSIVMLYGNLFMCLTLIPPLIFALLLKEHVQIESKLQQSEDLWKFALESGGQGVWDWNPATGKIYFSPTWKSMLGYSENDIANTNDAWAALVHPDDLERVTYEENRHLKGEVNEYVCDYRIRCKNETYMWIHDHGKIISRSSHGKPLRMIGTHTDISALKAAEQALSAEKERLRITLESIRDAVIVTNRHGRITYINPAAEELLVYSAELAKGKELYNICNISSEESGESLEDPIENCLTHDRVYYFNQDAILTSHNGVRHYIQDSTSPLRSPQNEIVGAVLVLQDQTINRNLHRDLKYHATHDALTNLINRREFEFRLKKMLNQNRDDNVGNCLLFIDLDRFKIINDDAGHVAGDELLRKISIVLQNNLREVDILARLGGDEFAVILPDCLLQNGARVGEFLINALKEFRFLWGGKIYEIGASIGLVNFAAGEITYETLIGHADIACYTSKQQGGNLCSIYVESRGEIARYHSEIQIAARIQDALQNNRFQLFTQLTQSLNHPRTNKKIYEILIRMLDDAGNIIMPAAFISAAERNNLMIAIDEWVLNKLLLEYESDIVQSGDLAFSINISSHSINSPSFLLFLDDILSRTSIQKANIGFELNETAILNHIEKSINVLNIIQKHGCYMCLDNFGIGLSSFNYLKSCSVKFIKIDGSLIKMIDKSDIDLAIVESIHLLAHRLGAKTIANHVETRHVMEICQRIGIDYAQGHYFGKIISLEELLESIHIIVE